MSRALAVFAGCLLIVASTISARADSLARSVATLEDANASYKERLASELVLSKSMDARAVIALADALGKDGNATIRRFAALGLEKNVEAHTAEDAKALAFDALDRAAGGDADPSVRSSAAAALQALARLRPERRRHGAVAAEPHGDRPEVLVKIEPTADQTRTTPLDVSARLTSAVKGSIEHAGYATAWPGGLPTSSELSTAHARGYVVAATVRRIELSRVGRQTQVACTVSIRVAPWNGRDGGEKWEASKAAEAQGSAKATTGSSDREIHGGMRDCLEAVAEDLTAKQVLPFLRRLVVAGN